MITVAQLIEFLKTQPQWLPVAYELYSEQCLLDLSSIKRERLQAPRPDGWVHHARPDREQMEYLVFPGN